MALSRCLLSSKKLFIASLNCLLFVTKLKGKISERHPSQILSSRLLQTLSFLLQIAQAPRTHAGPGLVGGEGEGGGEGRKGRPLPIATRRQPATFLIRTPRIFPLPSRRGEDAQSGDPNTAPPGPESTASSVSSKSEEPRGGAEQSAGGKAEPGGGVKGEAGGKAEPGGGVGQAGGEAGGVGRAGEG